MILKEMVEQFHLKQGDKIWLSSEVLKLALLCQKNAEDFDGNTLIELFQHAIGNEGTILIPTFCFDFSNNHYYEYNSLKCMSGALGKIALCRKDFVRTSHPMHSFAVWGKDQKLLANMTNKHAFGDDSPFGFCKENNVLQVMLGTDFVHAMTYTHYIETKCNVPYRFEKSFTGIYVTNDGIKEQRTYDYAARKLEIEPTEKINRIGDILLKNNIAKKFELFGITSYLVNLTEATTFLMDDILKNNCKNIYDFNIKREDVFKNYTVKSGKWVKKNEN